MDTPSPLLRSPSVTVAGAITIGGSALIVLGFLLAMLGLLIVPATPNAPMPPAGRVMGLTTLVFALAYAVFGIFTGVGLFRLKNWARISVMVWAVLSLFFLGFSVFLFFVLPIPQIPGNPTQPQAIFRGFILVMYGIPAVIGVWYLILFNRKQIVAQFTSTAPSAPQAFGSAAAGPLIDAKPQLQPAARHEGLPVAVLILAFLMLIFAVFGIASVFMSLPAMVFGRLFYGRAADAFYAGIDLLYAVGGIGLLLRKGWSYPVAIATQVVLLINGVVCLLSPNLAAMQTEMVSHSPFAIPEQTQYTTQMMQRMQPMAWFGLSLPLIVIGVLLYYRKRFFQLADKNPVVS